MVCRSIVALLIGISTVSCLGGCEDREEAEAKSTEPDKDLAAVASAKAALEAAQKAAAERAANPPEPEGLPELKVTDLELTDERRSKIESAIPEAKGFVTAKELEAKLHEKKLDDETKAVRTWDAAAKDKWVLITGNVGNKTEDSLDLAVTYTPQAENDPMGMSKKFFFVNLSGIEGYEAENYKNGQFAVMLMKYDGQKKASKGHDVVALGHWM